MGISHHHKGIPKNADALWFTWKWSVVDTWMVDHFKLMYVVWEGWYYSWLLLLVIFDKEVPDTGGHKTLLWIIVAMKAGGFPSMEVHVFLKRSRQLTMIRSLLITSNRHLWSLLITLLVLTPVIVGALSCVQKIPWHHGVFLSQPRLTLGWRFTPSVVLIWLNKDQIMERVDI